MPRIWITDGSPIPFSDVKILNATHKSLLGLSSKYKGLVDPTVSTGSTSIEATTEDDVLYAEAEWCILLPDDIKQYIENPTHVTQTTPLKLQGLIEGKWLNRLLIDRSWAPATLGNNLLAEGPGIKTTIESIESGEIGEVTVSYNIQSGGEKRQQVQRSTLSDLQGQNILGLVRDVLRLCGELKEPIDGVDLSAMGQQSAVVNENNRIRSAMRLSVLPIINPVYFIQRHDLMRKVVRGIISEGASVPPGEPVTIVTRDQTGRVVGEGNLKWISR